MTEKPQPQFGYTDADNMARIDETLTKEIQTRLSKQQELTTFEYKRMIASSIAQDMENITYLPNCPDELKAIFDDAIKGLRVYIAGQFQGLKITHTPEGEDK